MRLVPTAAALAALALAAPAAAQGARYFNGDAGDGGRAVTTKHTIGTLEVYCAGEGYYDRELAFSMSRAIGIRRDRTFSYSGTAFRYGPERQARGEQRVRLSGRVGSSAVRIRWSLPGCGTGNVTVPAER